MMRNLGLLILVTIIVSSCALTSSYKNVFHSDYAERLTPSQKERINQNGEILKYVQLSNPSPNSLKKGTLRILKTENPNIFNFVEVGTWITHSKYGNSGSYHNIEFRDTTTYDSLGNQIERRTYDKYKVDDFQLASKLTAEYKENQFIQHIKYYHNNILIAERSQRVLHFELPKSDLEKEKLKIGAHKNYDQNGVLETAKWYDINGKLIRKERYKR